MNLLTLSSQPPVRFPSRRKFRRRANNPHKGAIFRASASANGGGSGFFSWEEVSGSIRRDSERFASNFGETLKKETGIDLGSAIVKARELVSKGKEAVDRFRSEVMPEFVEFNKWNNWKVLFFLYFLFNIRY